MIGNNPCSEPLVYFLNCFVNRIKPNRDILLHTDLDKLMEQAKFHMVSAIVAAALKPYFSDREIFTEEKENTLRTIKNNAIRRAMMQEGEREALFKYLNENKIWYLPMKGLRLCDVYPEFGVREMSDVDILTDDEYTEQIHDYMINRGYEVEEYKRSNHDAYIKPPIYEFEIHRDLYWYAYENLYNYYKDVKSRLVKVPGREYEYSFTDEDLFIFLITHAHKHIVYEGTGLRTFSDLYLYMKKYKLDWDYINAEFEKLGISDDAKLIISFSNTVFAPEAAEGKTRLNEEQAKLFGYVMTSGKVGHFSNFISNRLQNYAEADGTISKKSKFKYVWGRIFPAPERIRMHYPFFYKHKWARPFLIFVRLFKLVTEKREKVKSELDTIKKA